MSALDDRIRAVLDGTIEALRRVVEDTADAASADTRHEAERQISALRADTEQQLASVRDASERAREELTRAARDEVAVLQRVLDELREQHAREIQDVRRRLDEARRDLSASTHEVGALRRALGEARAAGERVEQDLTRSDRLSAAFRSLEEAGTLGEVLDALARVSGGEAGRAAVFLVKGDRLTDWRTVGFGAGGPVPDMALESRACGLLGEVACSGSARERAGGAGPALPAFADGEGARHAIGLPVVVGGAVVAVLYADAEIGNGAPAGWPDRLGAVTRHASRVLEALTLHQAVARRAKRPGRR